MGGIGEAAQRALDLLFPPRCAACGAAGALLCASCLATIQSPQPPLCVHCGLSLATDGPTDGPDVGRAAGSACLDCASSRRLSSLDGLRAASVYEGAARQAILALKFRGQRRLAHPLADLLAAYYTREGLHADLLLPVRLHRARRRQRGYDQAELLARALGRRLGLPVRTELIVRQRATAPQTTLSREQRRANVAGAFALTSPAARHVLAGKRVLLVDDVTTTGSTMDAVAAALRAAAPMEIWALAVARPSLATGDTDTAMSAPRIPTRASRTSSGRL